MAQYQHLPIYKTTYELLQHADAFRAREQFANLLRRHGHLVSIHNNHILLTP